MRHHQPLHRTLHCQSHAALQEGFRLVVQDSGIRKVAQYVDIDMPGTALRQDGVDRAFGFDHTGRLSGADTKHGPATARAYCLRCLNEARLAVSGIEDEVDAPAAGQPRDFGSDIVALVVKDVMRPRLSGQRYRLRRAATADDESCPEDARGHLHGEMADPASAARDVDRVTSSDS